MNSLSIEATKPFSKDYSRQRSDRLMNYFLPAFFCTGFIFAFFYDTWSIAFFVGGICLLAYYSVKKILPDSDLYQYVLSVVLGIFMAQYIYQMHGLLEMHFFAFIGSALLITYQNWKLQIPILLVVTVHHGTLGYLQNSGVPGIYFTQLDYFELQTFIIHIALSGIIFFICGLWSYQLKRYHEVQISQAIETARLQKEAQLSLERKKNEEALKVAYEQAEKARQEAEQASKAKSTFLATMSHEIRTPMNGVIGTTSLLIDTALSDEQMRYAEIIRTSGENLLSVINDILDFSKIESEKLELEQRPFDLRSCVEEVLDLFAGKAAQVGVDLIYQMNHNVPAQIYGDPVRLKQILQNLTGNAIKFTNSGEIFIDVKLLNQQNDEVQIGFEVRDTGIGIPADKLGILFQAFTQVDSSTTRKYGGTGLGLVIAKRLTELMSGEIYVESQPGKGSSFHFSISTKACTQSVRNYVYTHVAGLENKRVLIVDDNDTNLKILKDQLENWKFVAIVAHSPEEAISILEKQKFELVISDMQMPVMDGAELAVHIKKKDPQLPIILLSSLGDNRSKKNEQLFCSVLAKPIKQKELHKAIVHAFKKDQIVVSDKPLPQKQKMTSNFSKDYPLEILIAEDNPVNQTLINMVMKKLGYDALMTVNGLKAFEALNKKQYDLVLMDVQMPEMDGLEATKLVRAQLPYQPVIIAVTANAMQEDKETCLQAGMEDYISKPIQMEKLIDLLKKWGSKIKAKKATKVLLQKN